MLRLCTIVNQDRPDPILAADVILSISYSVFSLHYTTLWKRFGLVKVNLLNDQKI
jgi:hypothetical protein